MQARNTKQNQIKSTYQGKYSLSTSSRCHSARSASIVEYSGPLLTICAGQIQSAELLRIFYAVYVTFVLCAFPTCFTKLFAVKR